MEAWRFIFPETEKTVSGCMFLLNGKKIPSLKTNFEFQLTTNFHHQLGNNCGNPVVMCLSKQFKTDPERFFGVECVAQLLQMPPKTQPGGFPGRGLADSHGDNDNNVRERPVTAMGSWTSEDRGNKISSWNMIFHPEIPWSWKDVKHKDPQRMKDSGQDLQHRSWNLLRALSTVGDPEFGRVGLKSWALFTEGSVQRSKGFDSLPSLPQMWLNIVQGCFFNDFNAYRVPNILGFPFIIHPRVQKLYMKRFFCWDPLTKCDHFLAGLLGVSQHAGPCGALELRSKSKPRLVVPGGEESMWTRSVNGRNPANHKGCVKPCK